MNKSVAYKAAQYSVLANAGLCDSDKLEVLRVLMEAEDLALFCEKQEEKKQKEKETENAETL